MKPNLASIAVRRGCTLREACLQANAGGGTQTKAQREGRAALARRVRGDVPEARRIPCDARRDRPPDADTVRSSQAA